VRRFTKAAIGGIAGCALALGGTQVASGALSNILKIQGFAEDLATSTEGPLDSARAKIVITEGTNSTTFTVRITGIDPAIQGTTLGGHLHTGECKEGDPTAAGPHYNDQVVNEGKVAPTSAVPYPDNAAEVSTNTEVWFDFVANAEGMAYDQTTVLFKPDDSDPAKLAGVMSVVVHMRSTNTDYDYPHDGFIVGDAGGRQACFPLSVPQWGSDPI
jgi:Cu/Zn superoxide dismutase